MGYLRDTFFEMRCEIVILIFDMKIDSILILQIESNLILVLIFDLRLPSKLILFCDNTKRGFKLMLI